jgi:hypothetical protein
MRPCQVPTQRKNHDSVVPQGQARAPGPGPAQAQAPRLPGSQAPRPRPSKFCNLVFFSCFLVFWSPITLGRSGPRSCPTRTINTKRTTRVEGKQAQARARPSKFCNLVFIYFFGFLVPYRTLGLKAFWARPRPSFKPKPRPRLGTGPCPRARPRPRPRPMPQGQAQAHRPRLPGHFTRPRPSKFCNFVFFLFVGPLLHFGAQGLCARPRPSFRPKPRPGTRHRPLP